MDCGDISGKNVVRIGATYARQATARSAVYMAIRRSKQSSSQIVTANKPTPNIFALSVAQPIVLERSKYHI